MFNLSLSLKEDFIQLIAKHTGILIRPTDQSTLDEKIFTRIKNLKLSSTEEYYNLLASFNDKSKDEWQNFMILLTNLESYFFRDKGQFNLFRNHLIPELIQKKQNQRVIRICSAGCSTGQEPYSLAILFHELIPNIETWNISIVGLDINSDALHQARKGAYNSWSFRSVEDDIKSKYFSLHNGKYHISSKLKKMVTFKQTNLVNDSFDNNDFALQELDLIICRNVFIYFQPEAIDTVINKFFSVLREDGYLITGHAEITNQAKDKFHVQSFPESIVYKKTKPNTKTHQSLPLNSAPNFQQKTLLDFAKTSNIFNTVNENKTNIVIPQINPFDNQNVLNQANNFDNKLDFNNPILKPQEEEKIETKPTITLEEIENLFIQKSYKLALEKAEEILAKDSNNIKVCEIIAKIHANTGNYEQAKKYCLKVIEINSLSINSYYILSHIAEENGDREEAKKLLKKIIYLEPNFLPAYYELSYIYGQEGEKERQAKMDQIMLDLLTKLPKDHQISELDNITAKALKEKIQK